MFQTYGKRHVRAHRRPASRLAVGTMLEWYERYAARYRPQTKISDIH